MSYITHNLGFTVAPFFTRQKPKGHFATRLAPLHGATAQMEEISIRASSGLRFGFCFSGGLDSSGNLC